MARNLPGFPEELISNIACRLGSDDKFALRLTCLALEQKSFHEFATEHFTQKCVHFTTDSLKVLVDISASRMAKYLKYVCIVAALFSELAWSCPGHRERHWKPTVRQSEAYKFYIQDQTTLCNTGNDRKMLTKAFKSLPSLATIALVDSYTLVKAGSDYRGGNKVLRQTGTKPIDGLSSTHRIRSPEFRKHIEHLWSATMKALAATEGQPSVEELATSFGTEFNFLAAKQFSFKPSTLTKLSGALGNLTRLHLHVKTPTDAKRYRNTVSNFTTALRSLKELKMDFDYKPNSGDLLQKFTAQINMSQLTSLNLIGLSIDATQMAKMVTRLKNLEDLRLFSVDLISGTWPPVLKAMAELEHLGHLHLMYLREAGLKSYFLEQHEPHDHVDDGAFAYDVFDDGWDDELDDDDDDEDDDGLTDDDLPDLEVAHDTWAPATETASNNAGPAPTTQDPVGQGHGVLEDEDVVPEYVPKGPPNRSWGGERGFFVCIKGHDIIGKRLQTFIKEYNVGDFAADDGGFGFGAIPAGFTIPIPVPVAGGAFPPGPPAGPPPGFGAAFMNAVFGPGGPLPGFPPHHANPPPGGAHGGNAAANGNPAPPAQPANPPPGPGAAQGGSAATNAFPNFPPLGAAAAAAAPAPPVVTMSAAAGVNNTYNDPFGWDDGDDWEEQSVALSDDEID